MHLATFMYFPGGQLLRGDANINGSCKLIESVFTWYIFKTWPWNKNLSIKACYRFLLSFFRFLVLKTISKQLGNSVVPRPQREFYGIKNSDKKLVCASFWESILSLILLAMNLSYKDLLYPELFWLFMIWK